MSQLLRRWSWSASIMIACTVLACGAAPAYAQSGIDRLDARAIVDTLEQAASRADLEQLAWAEGCLVDAATDPEAPLGIDLIRASHEQAMQLRPGQTVTVSCQRVNRTGEERWLQNCAIQTVEGSGDSASPASPADAPADKGNKGGA